MRMQKVGVRMSGSKQVTNIIVPKTIDGMPLILVDTVFNNAINKGETAIHEFDRKTFYEVETNVKYIPHSTAEDAIKVHTGEVKKWRRLLKDG